MTIIDKIVYEMKPFSNVDFRMIVSAVLLLLIVIPVGFTYVYATEEAVVMTPSPVFVWGSLETVIPFGLFYACWFLRPRFKGKVWRRIAMVFTLLWGLFLLGVFILWVILPIQDFTVSYGALLFLLVFPLLSIYYLLEAKQQKNQGKLISTDILDDLD